MKQAFPTGNFDPLANSYCWWEYLAFGSGLETARFRYIDALKNAQNVLLLGDGDGRFLKKLVSQNKQAYCVSIDTSLKMIQRAQQRCSAQERQRITWIHNDALNYDFTQNTFDAIVTLFVLDLFSQEQQTRLFASITPNTTPHAVWLFADFSPPDTLRKQLWIQLLNTFFKQRCKIPASYLHSPLPMLKAQGFELINRAHFSYNLYEAALLKRNGDLRVSFSEPVDSKQ